MKKYIVIGMLLLTGCQKELKTSDILSDLTVSPLTIDADGSSQISVSVRLTDNAASDKRNISFSTTAGSFTGGANGKITVPATYQNGQIIAKATLIAPAAPGTITITAASESLTINGDFYLTTQVTAVNVDPAAIKLSASGFGIASNFISEDTLSAKISGIKGNNASKGVKVQFEDLLNNGAAAGGRFRELQATSNALSTVSAIYGAPALPIGTPITLRVTVLDATGAKTAITNLTTLTINK